MTQERMIRCDDNRAAQPDDYLPGGRPAGGQPEQEGLCGRICTGCQGPGVHQLSSAALIPTELGQENQNYIRRAFTGSDRGGPSKVVAVVIATGTEDTTALEAGLKSIEG